jgi:high affinity sulfate transporter 1
MGAEESRRKWSRYLPIAEWWPSCSATTLRADVIAGIALAGLLVPEGMAYAGIAGVPPQMGLYSAAAGLLVYALFGSSRQLAVTPTSGSAAMLAVLVGPLALGDPAHYAALASATALLAGLLFLLGSLFKLGFVAEFISKPVLKGFVFGLALTIMVKQAPKMLGIERGQGDFFDQVWHILTSLGETHLWTLAVGIVTLAITFLMGSYLPRIPSALVVLVLGILTAGQFQLHAKGVEIVGSIQTGIPHFGIPLVSRAELPDLFAGAMGIVLIVVSEALAAGRTFAAKYRYEITPNQELAAIGAANLASGLSQGFIVGGGMSGTAANAAGGAKTPVSSITASLLVLLTLLFLMPLFQNLPEAVLGAIVIHAVWHLADIQELRRLTQLRTGSIWVALTALGGVLMFGILRGLILAVALTLVVLMKRVSAPNDSLLGRLPGSNVYVDTERYPEAELIPGLLIVRPNGPLFFANANRIKNRVRTLFKESPRPIQSILLDLGTSPEIDVTSLDMLRDLRKELKESEVELSFARVLGPVRDLFQRSGFLSDLGAEKVFLVIHQAVDAHLKKRLANEAERPPG